MLRKRTFNWATFWVQLYRSDKLDYLKKTIDKFKKQNIKCGFKLVRGAYLEKESHNALKDGNISPINKTKEKTDEDFNMTYSLLEKLNISYLHVFTYSERPNTEAISFEGIISPEVRSKRSKMLRGLSQKKRRSFYESQLGTEQEVLFESENKRGYIHGFTANYVKVKTFWHPTLCNSIKLVRLTEIDDDGLVKFD